MREVLQEVGFYKLWLALFVLLLAFGLLFRTLNKKNK